jgi:hypothetical protein
LLSTSGAPKKKTLLDKVPTVLVGQASLIGDPADLPVIRISFEKSSITRMHCESPIGSNRRTGPISTWTMWQSASCS